MLAKRGDDPDKQGEIYAGMINAALEGRPRDLVVTTHVCRGNFRSTFIASGGYEPIADLLFNRVNVDGYFLEWDSDRAGGFEPLRFLPKGKTVVLGLVTSKTGRIERQGFHQAPHRGGGEIRAASTSCACRRNAASPRPRKAMCSPRTNNGPSCVWSSSWPTRSGVDAASVCHHARPCAGHARL